jgi:phosphatidylinositol alpha-1,6-mannosyltransferase
MKVLLLTPFYRPDNYGGAVQVYESLLKNQNFHAHIICPKASVNSPSMDDVEYYNKTDTHIHRCPKIQFSYSSKSIVRRISDFILYRRTIRKEILKTINEIQPDIIINGGVRWFSWMNNDFIKIAPVINYIHGEELSIKPVGLFGKWLLKTQNNSFSNVNLNLCVSSYTANKVLEISSRAKVSVLTNFVDTERYYPVDNKSELKIKHKLESKVSLICVCRLIKRKGVDDLLYALKKIKSDGSKIYSVVLNVCGSGPELDSLKALSIRLGLAEIVEFHGFTDESVMLELLQASDIFIMPNKTVDGDLEGFGLVFLEANACGLPVIGGSSGGVIDAIEDGVSGLLIEPGSIESISKNLIKLIDDEIYRDSLGQQGKTRAQNNFSLNRKRTEFYEVLSNVEKGEDLA